MMDTCQWQTVKKKKKLKKKTKLRIALIVILSFIILCIFYYFKVVCPIVIRLSEEKIRSVATTAISEVVGDVMSNENFTYNDLVHITYSSANKIELIEVDTVQVNIVIRKITEEDKKKCWNR